MWYVQFMGVFCTNPRKVPQSNPIEAIKLLCQRQCRRVSARALRFLLQLVQSLKATHGQVYRSDRTFHQQLKHTRDSLRPALWVWSKVVWRVHSIPE